MSNITRNRIFTALAFGVLASCAYGQGSERLVVPLSDPARPARLEISLFSGDIEVEAYDGNQVVVMTDAPLNSPNAESSDPRADGLKRIQTSSVGMTIEENANTVSVRMDFSPRNSDVRVQVPRRTSVKANLVNGDIEVSGVTGEHELTNVNGDVVVTDISGSAIANSTNGDVRATFAAVDAAKPMSLTSFNGDVDVSLPAKIQVDLIVASQQGDVFTDFEATIQNDPATVEQHGEAGGRYRVRMQRNTRYTIGSGGADINLRTFNGDIFIRKR